MLIDDPKPGAVLEATADPTPMPHEGRPTPTGEMLDDDALDALCDASLRAIERRDKHSADFI